MGDEIFVGDKIFTDHFWRSPRQKEQKRSGQQWSLLPILMNPAVSVASLDTNLIMFAKSRLILGQSYCLKSCREKWTRNHIPIWVRSTIKKSFWSIICAVNFTNILAIIVAKTSTTRTRWNTPMYYLAHEDWQCCLRSQNQIRDSNPGPHVIATCALTDWANRGLEI